MMHYSSHSGSPSTIHFFQVSCLDCYLPLLVQTILKLDDTRRKFLICIFQGHLLIPGSHDSFTSGIVSSSDLAPDAEDILRKLQWLGPLLKKFVVDWSRTQDFYVTDQLKNGVRYFDLRFGTKPGTDELFIVHGLYSYGATEIFDRISFFLEEHQHEVSRPNFGKLDSKIFLFFSKLYTSFKKCSLHSCSISLLLFICRLLFSTVNISTDSHSWTTKI